MGSCRKAVSPGAPDFHSGAPGAVPAGGGMIVSITIECHGALRLTIMTDKAVIVIEIP